MGEEPTNEEIRGFFGIVRQELQMVPLAPALGNKIEERDCSARSSRLGHKQPEPDPIAGDEGSIRA
jgi:hypothetical protein